jgi:hypothetical protein
MIGMDREVFEYYPRQGSGPRYVSASKLYAVLRGKLGCTDMGWRDRGSWYWITPNGVPFPVTDPAADADCKAVFSANGRRELYFSYVYARELIARVRGILKMEAPRAIGGMPRVQPNA